MTHSAPVLQPPSQPRPKPFSRGRRVGLTPRGRHPAAASVDAPTDARITSLIASARRFAHRQRDLHADFWMAADVGARAFRQDWAVRAGEIVLTARAGQSARAVPLRSTTPATDPTWLVGL